MAGRLCPNDGPSSLVRASTWLFPSSLSSLLSPPSTGPLATLVSLKIMKSTATFVCTIALANLAAAQGAANTTAAALTAVDTAYVAAGLALGGSVALEQGSILRPSASN